MSIAKQNIIQNITRLISDPILREQMIELHLGKLTPEQIEQIRIEKEQEAEEILKLFPKQTSPDITNGEAKDTDCSNN